MPTNRSVVSTNFYKTSQVTKTFLSILFLNFPVLYNPSEGDRLLEKISSMCNLHEFNWFIVDLLVLERKLCLCLKVIRETKKREVFHLIFSLHLHLLWSDSGAVKQSCT